MTMTMTMSGGVGVGEADDSIPSTGENISRPSFSDIHPRKRTVSKFSITERRAPSH